MEATDDFYSDLVKASVAAERAFQVAVSNHHAEYPELYRSTWATAAIIQCDMIRYLVTLENSPQEGFVRLLWMGDVVSALYEAKKWFFGTGNKNLLAMARDVDYDINDLQEQIKHLKKRHRLDGIERYKNYRNKVGYHYGDDLIDHLRRFSEMGVEDFHAVLSAYKNYSNGWGSLFLKVLDSKPSSFA